MKKLLNKLTSNTVVDLGASFSTGTKQENKIKISVAFKILRTLRWEGHVACVRERRNSCRVLVGKPQGNRSPAGSRRRWKDIKMYLKGICRESANCVNPVQDTEGWRAVVNMDMNIRVPPQKNPRRGFLDQLTNSYSLSTTLFD